LRTAEVGSVLPRASLGGSFQRVDDSEITAEVPASRAPATIAAHVETFIDDVADETLGRHSFQRVSDDEDAEGPATEEPQAADQTAAKKSRTRKLTTTRTGKKKAAAGKK